MLARMLNDFTPLMRLQGEMSRILENSSEEMPAQRSYAGGYPGINLWEDGDNAFIEAELPGMNLEDLEVFVMGDQLTINGQRKIVDQPGAMYHRRERATGKFSRTMTLPWQMDAESVQAKLVNGVLAITLPKAASAKPKKIRLLSA